MKSVFQTAFFLAAGSILFVISGSVYAEDPVVFVDPAFKTLVEDALGVTDPTPTDMLDLTRLYANGVTSVYDVNGIGYAHNLRSLSLPDNQLTTLPSEIGNLTQLSSLYLPGNKITSLPPEIRNLSRLSELFLDGNQLTTLPPEFGNLEQLDRLYLSNNLLTTLPQEFGNLSHLDELYLDGNQFTSFPSSVLSIPFIWTLSIKDNPLGSLPPEIGNMSSVMQLDLSNTQLTSLPPEFSKIDVYDLFLRGNQFQTFPPALLSMHMPTLDLSENQISYLPAEIEDQNVGVLLLSSNQLTTLPPEIADADLSMLYIDNNPIIYHQLPFLYPTEVILEPNPNPMSCDGLTTFFDFVVFSEQWLATGCNELNNWCNGADFFHQGYVGLDALDEFASLWLHYSLISPIPDYPYYYLDNFNDNQIDPMWTVADSNDTNCWLEETNQRLEVRATNESNNDYALYTGTGWHFDTTEDFSFKLRYRFDIESSNWSELLLAIGPASDIENNHIQFSICTLNEDALSEPSFYYQLQQNGSQVEEMYFDRYLDEPYNWAPQRSGWLTVSYTARNDRLQINNYEYGPSTLYKDITGLLGGAWSGLDISVHIGGSSDHVEMQSGQAYWDDFIIHYGQILYE